MKSTIVLLIGILGWQVCHANSQVLPMRERAALIDQMLEDRLEHLLPALMRREGIDMWVMISREYNEDPVLETMLPSTWLSARRRTILVMHDPGEGQPVERVAVARYQVDSLFRKGWDKEQQSSQWKALIDFIAKKQPKRIGINKSTHFALADGMTATEYEELMQEMPFKMRNKVVSAEKLAIGWLETRSDMEMKVYPQLIAMGHAIIAEAFSEKVITPGLTSTEDVVWWLRDKSREIRLTNWFHPTVSIQRGNDEAFDHLRSFSKRPGQQIIQPGDLLHVDFGLTYLRLHSDQQQHAYVLKPGESEAPAGLKNALHNANRLQDIFTDLFAVGRSGNEVLKRARQQAIAEGIKPAIYTHPIGYHGHAAGTALGMWDAQGGVPFSGDYPLHANTAYSIELNASTFVPEFGKEVRIMLEEEAFFDGKKVFYLDGRQTGFHLIPTGAYKN